MTELGPKAEISLIVSKSTKTEKDTWRARAAQSERRPRVMRRALPCEKKDEEKLRKKKFHSLYERVFSLFSQK